MTKKTASGGIRGGRQDVDPDQEQEATNGGSAPLRCAGGLPGPIGSLSETLPQGVATACGNTVACEAPVSGSNTLAHNGPLQSAIGLMRLLQELAARNRAQDTNRFDIPIDSINSMHCLCDLKRLACADSTLRGLF